MEIALITGASRGLGRALSQRLAEDGWGLVIDARAAGALREAQHDLGHLTQVVALPGDIADASHRAALVAAAAGLGGLDLLVNNAGILGPSPQPNLADYPLGVLAEVYAVNVIAQLGLVQVALPLLDARRGRILNVTSHAAGEPY